MAACRRAPKGGHAAPLGRVGSRARPREARPAVVGSCSSAVPTWTATAPASRNGAGRRRGRRRRRRRRAATSGSARVHVGARSAARRARSAGPLRPAGRPSGIAAGSALPMTTASAPASGTVRALSTDPGDVGAQLGQHRAVGGELAADRGHHAGRVEGLADVEEARRRPASGAPRLTSSPATPGARPRRRARSAYSPIVEPAIDTTTRAPCAHQPRQLGGQEVLEAGVGQADRVDQPAGRLDDPGRRAAGAGVEGDRAGDEVEAGEPVRSGVRRQLAAGAAAARRRP